MLTMIMHSLTTPNNSSRAARALPEVSADWVAIVSAACWMGKRLGWLSLEAVIMSKICEFRCTQGDTARRWEPSS